MATIDGRWMSTRHESIFTHLQQEIAEERLPPGSKLPGERKLAEDLGVSRETVRLGLRMAEQAGLIVRVPAMGTFVAPSRVDQDLGHMDTFDSTVRNLHMDPSYESLKIARAVADESQAERLGVVAGVTLLSVEAIGVANGLPLAHYQSLLPPHVIERLPENPQWGTAATYQIAVDAMGLSELEVSQEFESVQLPRPMAQLMRVSTKSPGFRVVSLFSSGTTPIELRTAWYPGSRYRFRVSRQVHLNDNPAQKSS